MADIVERLARMTRDGWRYYDQHEGDSVHCAIQDAGKEITTLRDRCAKLDKALEESRGTNRKLHRRLQIAEAVSQSAFDFLKGWLYYLRNSANHRPRKERYLLTWIIRDAMEKVRRLSARAALDQDKGGGE